VKRRRILYGIARNTYQRLEGALRYAQEHDWDLCVDPALTWNIPLRWKGDGIIALLAEETPLTDYVLRRPEPKVLIENTMPHVPGPRVINDNVAAGRMAADYFTGLGFRHYAFVRLRDMYFNADQQEGFVKTLEAGGHACSVHAFTDPRNRYRHPESWARNVLKRLPQPVAIFAADDVLAADLVDLAVELGIRVPRDVAVLGTPNIAEIANHARVPVSSVEMNEEGLTYRACEILDAILHGASPPPSPVRVAPRGVVERASTDVVVVEDRLVRDAIETMRARIAEPIGIEQIAAGLHTDRRHLAQAFRRALGRSPHDVLREQRIRKVRELLTSTDLTLPLIARRTGFTTHQYLCRAFRQATGMTPSAYRHEKGRTETVRFQRQSTRTG